jgi:predicted aspartyl protease
MKREFRLDLTQKIILVDARIFGVKESHRIRMIVDTGAAYTMVSPEILVKIGCNPVYGETRPIATASGIEYVSFLKVPSMKAFGFEVRDLEVTAHALPTTLPARGLLGINFLKNFNVHFKFLESKIEIESSNATYSHHSNVDP